MKSSRLPPWFVRSWLGLSVVLSMVLGPLLVRGDQASRSQTERHLKIIAGMSGSERDRLERNRQAFTKLTQQELATMQQFHTELERDDRERGGELGSVLDEYHRWLDTLEPFQRDQLKRTQDADERLALMKRLIAEQRSRDASRVFQGAFSNPRDPRSRLSPPGRTPVLSAEELDKLMQGMEQLEQFKLTEIQKADVRGKSGLDRYITFLEHLKQNVPGNRNEPERRGLRVIPQFQEPFVKLAQRFDVYVSDSEARDYISAIESERIPSVDLRMQALLMKSMISLSMSQQKTSDIPTLQQRQDYFILLSEEEQDRLFELEAVEFNKELSSRISQPTEVVGVQAIVRSFLSREDFERWPGNRTRGRDSRSGGPGNPPGPGREPGTNPGFGTPGRPGAGSGFGPGPFPRPEPGMEPPAGSEPGGPGPRGERNARGPEEGFQRPEPPFRDGRNPQGSRSGGNN